MENRYKQEIDEFLNFFAEYKDARIVLYGIGRYTSTLLEGQTGYRFVGLMDKDPENIGKNYFGLPVIDKQTAEKNADMVIINTSETYWSVIYNRISDIKIPVYYKNGKRARTRSEENYVNPYKDFSLKSLSEKIEQADIISFDFFDTIFMRSVCSPQDVFCLLDRLFPDYFSRRNKAKLFLDKYYSLEELYVAMIQQCGITKLEARQIKELEIQLEKQLLKPRKMILELLQRILEKDIEVFIVSDMYLPKQFYQEILVKYGILIPEECIIISNEVSKSKSDGTIWEYFIENYSHGQKVLHIGDDKRADYDLPRKYGIDTYFVPSVWQLFQISSINSLMPQICTLYAQTIMGSVLTELFSNPYLFSGKNGKIFISDHYQMGYCVFGPVVLTFLLWLINQSKMDGIEKLIFLSRDGYFLEQDYKYLCQKSNQSYRSMYLGISRQLAMAASVTNEEELLEYANMPYSGSLKELFEDRFDISITTIEEYNLNDYLKTYEEQIWKNLRRIRKNYLDYLNNFEIDEKCAVVDLGFYGNNQRYLNRLLQKRLLGYYFNANLSDKNPNTTCQTMKACFQEQGDKNAEKSEILKRMIYLESFLTAPYGMVKEVDEDGIFHCAPKGKNQIHFQEKMEINRGVQAFLGNWIDCFGTFELEPDTAFVDLFYGVCMGGAIDFSDEVKSSFYNDNAMMNRLESMLFY